MKCPNCGLENPPLATRCDCGYNFRTDEFPAQADPHSGVLPHVNDRFPALSFISAFLRFIGWLIVAGGIIVFAGSIANLVQSKTIGWFDAVPVLAGLVITALGAVAVAVGESVGVLFAIETNTRSAAERLSRLQ